MTTIKPRFDFTINFTNMLIILSAAFGIMWTWQDNQKTIQTQQRDIAELKATVSPLMARLAVIETQLKYTAEAVERIDRRTEARVGR